MVGLQPKKMIPKNYLEEGTGYPWAGQSIASDSLASTRTLKFSTVDEEGSLGAELPTGSSWEKTKCSDKPVRYSFRLDTCRSQTN